MCAKDGRSKSVDVQVRLSFRSDGHDVAVGNMFFRRERKGACWERLSPGGINTQCRSKVVVWFSSIENPSQSYGSAISPRSESWKPSASRHLRGGPFRTNADSDQLVLTQAADIAL